MQHEILFLIDEVGYRWRINAAERGHEVVVLGLHRPCGIENFMTLSRKAYYVDIGTTSSAPLRVMQRF